MSLSPMLDTMYILEDIFSDAPANSGLDYSGVQGYTEAIETTISAKGSCAAGPEQVHRCVYSMQNDNINICAFTEALM